MTGGVLVEDFTNHGYANGMTSFLALISIRISAPAA
jgi:hypothetical protein